MKRNPNRVQKAKLAMLTDVANHLIDARRIDGLWILPREPEEDGPVRLVTVAGQRQRSEQLDLHPRNPTEQGSILQFQTKLVRGAHGANRM